MATAERLKALLPDSEIHGLARRVEEADIRFDEAGPHLRTLFAAGRPILGLCAAGILIRALAPILDDKRAEPPVLAVAEDGGAAIPLLGGHRGANTIAHAVAAALGGTAAITTAGDLRLGLALDAPPPGWRLANPDLAGPVTAALLAGEAVALRVEAGDTAWLRESGADFAEADRAPAAWTLLATDRAVTPDACTLLYHPPSLALGVGCERGAAPEELADLVARTLDEAGLARESLALVASIDLKADEAAMHALAEALDVPVRFMDAEDLEREAPRLANPSEVVFRETGCHGVAEGAALAAVGPNGTLIGPKTKSARTTCAIARAPGDIDPAAIGRPRGSLAVIGIGPGPAAWRSPEAEAALAGADSIVGYALYLDLLGEKIAGKARHESPLGAEEDRVRTALDLAAEGRSVALVSSGDAGIYALAALVFELLEREDRADWNRIALAVCPGISAMQAAAARAGAPLGHDFCAISLSDLLTPWPAIETRLRAAAQGDFVTCLYNPASARRRGQLPRAIAILASARPPDTPVIVARNLGREGEAVAIVPLAEFDPETVDMLTLVLVGSSATRAIRRGEHDWVYTPRGYAAKAEPEIGHAKAGRG
ncbi:MAG: precorrin-3B C(17)-methyltransferase [Rhodospirillaceae bacterium]|nr:precorrin-3B C(17)-methyltransferase [Rhodospirillaceae bacterium]